MDKTWRWRKKSSEKTIAVNDKVNNSSTDNGEEALGSNKEDELERSVQDLNEKLSSALSECNAKDDLVTKHAKVAEEALAGWEKAEAEAVNFKQDLDEALRQRAFIEERTAQSDAALRECMQQLRFVREEQEQRVHDAVTQSSKQHEKVQTVLEEKLADTSKKLSKLSVENTHMTNAIQVKEMLIEDLTKRNAQLVADSKALMSKLQSTEKDFASLKYELCMLEKELEIQNEEKEYNRRSADASQKQHLESVKKIAKLESECQRLRVLVRKRLPGPAAVAQMKNEVELLGREPGESRRRKMNPPMGGSMVRDFKQDNSIDSPSKRVNYLIERLCTTEEENKVLKETISNKNDEIQSSRAVCARTASKLSQVETQLAELSKGQMSMELVKNSPISHGLSLASRSVIGEDSESWASALISELDHFRNEKPKGSSSSKTVGASDISLMDDFAEMEKLAIVCTNKSHESPHVSSGGNSTLMRPLEVTSPSEGTGKELVPVVDCHQGSSGVKKQLMQLTYAGKYPSWLHDILELILQQNRATRRDPYEIIEEVRTALAHHLNGSAPSEDLNAWKKSSVSSPSEPPHITGLISWKSPNDSPVASKRVSSQFQSSLSESISKIIELVEGIIQQSLTDCSSQQPLSDNHKTSLPYKNPVAPSGYTVRLFQWKSSELGDVLRQFAHTCTYLSSGKVDLEKFVRELTSTFDWVVNHCFSLQNVSSMDVTIKKHFDWDESQSESEQGVGVNSLYSETEKTHANKEENRKLKDELAKTESAKKDLEGKLNSATEKIQALTVQLQESEKSIVDLQTELETLKASKDEIEDQIENHRLLNEDLNSQLTEARVALHGARQKYSHLEVELEDRSNSCKELETTCLELQLQLESLAKKDAPEFESEQEERQRQNGWEITAASEKLAECQETILNLGKQLKALASPREAELLDKVISVTPSTVTTVSKNTRTSSLLDKMLADDDAEDVKSPQMKEIICTLDPRQPPNHSSDNANRPSSPNEPLKTLERFIGSNDTGYKHNSAAGGGLAIMPHKKRGGGGGGLLRKLLLRRKKGSSKKKILLPMVA